MAKAVARSSAPTTRQANGWLPVVLAWQVVIVVAAFVIAQRTIVGYVVGGSLLIAALVLTIPVNGRSLGRALVLRWRYLRRRAAKVDDPGLPRDLIPLGQWMPTLTVRQTKSAQGGEVGVITDGQSWTAVLGYTSDDELIATQGDSIDLAELTGLTHQDDIVFAGVQIVTYTVPAPTSVLLTPGSPAATSYREISAGAEPPAVRRTWLAIRLDPRLCLEAVARRGSGDEGVFATLRFGVHRVQTALKRQGIETRILDPMGIYEVLSLTAGSSPEQTPERTTETWREWTCDGLVHTGRAVRSWGSSPSLSYQQLLDAVAQAPVMNAITSFTWTPGYPAQGGLRLVTPTSETAAEAIEYVTDQLDARVKLGPLGGVQVPMMLATVPLGKRGVA